MQLDKALALKVGDVVRCPADRGTPAYIGPITHISGNVATHMGKEFIWVTVADGHGHRHVWPSNRLG